MPLGVGLWRRQRDQCCNQVANVLCGTGRNDTSLGDLSEIPLNVSAAKPNHLISCIAAGLELVAQRAERHGMRAWFNHCNNFIHPDSITQALQGGAYRSGVVRKIVIDNRRRIRMDDL